MSLNEQRQYEMHRTGFEAGMRYAAKVADDVSHLIVQPGNRFDQGYSQGRFEAARVILAALETMKQSEKESTK